MFAGSNRREMYIFLLVLTISSTVAFQGWRTLLNNFAVEVGGLSGFDMGIVQSVREVPGFLCLLAVYLLLFIREHRLAAVSVMVLGAGVCATGLFPSVYGVAFTTMIMSFGFHYYETMNQSLTLQYFDHAQAPLVLGRMRSVMGATNVGVGAVLFLTARYLGYSQMFAAVGAVAVCGGLWAFFRDPSKTDIAPQNKKMVLYRKYWLYYALTFLAGARRQVFVAFAVFLLVQRFGYSVESVTLLFVLNNVINYFVNPVIARALNRFGERRMLSLEYASLTLIFITYAYTQSALVVGLLYVADNVFFNFGMGIRTYFQKIADPGDIASGMAVGFTINHIAAVVVPFVGGVAWLANYRVVFLGAAVLSIVSLLLSQLVRTAPSKAVVRD
jgi:hypothetical protein